MARIEHRPGEPAPRGRKYTEHNVFGPPTGNVVEVDEGEELRSHRVGLRGALFKRQRVDGRGLDDLAAGQHLGHCTHHVIHGDGYSQETR